MSTSLIGKFQPVAGLPTEFSKIFYTIPSVFMKIAFLELIHEYLNRSSTSPETALRKEYNQNMTEYLSSVRLALRELQKALLDLYGKEAPELLLYGSYARGDATPASDVDVLLLYPT